MEQTDTMDTIILHSLLLDTVLPAPIESFQDGGNDIDELFTFNTDDELFTPLDTYDITCVFDSPTEENVEDSQRTEEPNDIIQFPTDIDNISFDSCSSCSDCSLKDSEISIPCWIIPFLLTIFYY